MAARESTLVESVQLGVTTWTVPVVAPAGTVAATNELDSTVNAACVQLSLTLVARSVQFPGFDAR